MKRRFRRAQALAALVAAVLAAGQGTGSTASDNSPIQKIMHQIQTQNRAIGKGLRAKTALDRNALAACAASLTRLGKEARPLTEPPRERMKSQNEWTRAVDDFLRASDEFATVIATPRTSSPQAMQSYQVLQKTCVNCHTTFR
jgi:cytochrome c556